MEKEGQKGLQVEGVLIPETPAKTALPRKPAIRTGMQEDELDQEESSESEGFPPGFCFPPGFAPRMEADLGIQHQDSPSTAETREFHFDDARSPGLNEELSAQDNPATAATPTNATDGHFSSLLALANVASTTAPPKDDARITPNSSFFYISSSNTEGDCSVLSNATDLTDSKIDTITNCPWVNDHHYHPTNGQQNPKLLAYDLNLPAPTMEDVSNVNLSFATVTPDKPLGKEARIASESQDSIADLTSYEQNRQDIETNKDAIGGLRSCRTKQSRDLQNHALLEEKDSIEKEDSSYINQEKTPQQKPRRKKHRPKVVIEGRPKKTPKSITPKSVASKGQTTGKRKYVRRKGLETSPTSPVEEAGDSTNLGITDRPKRSCRRSLNFNFDGEEMDEINMCEYFSVLELQMHNQQSKRTDSVHQGQECDVNAVSRGKTCNSQEMQDGYMSSVGKLEPRNTTYLKSDIATLLKEQNDFYQSKSDILTEQGSYQCEQAHNSINLDGVQYNSLQAYMALSWLNFPVEYKRKRTEKGQQPSSSWRAKTVNNCATEYKQHDNNSNTHSFASKVGDFVGASPSNIAAPTEDSQMQLLDKDNNQDTGCIQAFRQVERVKRKRSRGTIRVRNFASLIKIIESTKFSRETAMDDDLQKPQTCMEALLAGMHTLSRKKRTKKRFSLVTSAYSNTLKMQLHGTFTNSLDQPEWKHLLSVDAITKQLESLDINMETSRTALVPYKFWNQKDNTLVLYKGDGTLVPFEGSFDPMKRRHLRPKVDLDEETTRVWKLLLEDINNEGIDGTDEETERWWKEERQVFKGRTDSFIARMHLVQGDRRFSPWKGSVVDSVVGVFLTQNVSDHLSSSAFISLAARFPCISNQNNHSEEGTSTIIDESEAHIVDTEYTKKWRVEKTNATFCDKNSVNEMEQNGKSEVASSHKTDRGTTFINLMDESNNPELNSSGNITELFPHLFVEKSTVETKRGVQADYDVISSQNSNDSQVPQNDERLESSLQYSELKDSRCEPYCSRTKSLEVPTSFLQLLHMAGTNGLQGVDIQDNDDVSSNQNSKNALHHPVIYNEKGSKVEFSDTTTSASSSIHDSNIQDNENTKNFGKEIKCLEHSNNEIGENNGGRGPTIQDKIHLKEIFAEALRSSTETFHSWHGCPRQREFGNMQTEAQETFDRCEHHCNNHNIQQELHSPELPVQDEKSMNRLDTCESINQEATEEYGNDRAIIDESNEMNAKMSKTKTKNKEKQIEIDWDILRKQVEASGRSRERTPNTMDTVDWDAVRCTDINEIAETIKDRGMNNVLAGRIKDFLNRLVREHGSIDLEWLRNIPPDKAKEYLLSIRGLGLKSVECVRLLTLHHLAFPVDTNVGRIAVRLGWVPLQPLPESLQLHLLELYPVLESIQKYLWPRLCKLDQRTLYELHYQMITFGKVFCTKSKPNCNACPMRGECRHFASAFASARLALQGPEEKITVNTIRIESQESVEQLSLPFPLAEANSEGQQEDARPGLIDCQPIIEEPATPEPEIIQITENDMEDTFLENSDEIPTIKLDLEEFTQNLQNYMQKSLDLEETEVSKALVALTPEAASIPVPKLKNMSQLRTEHLVYELPEGHPLLNGLDNLEPDDPSKYLLAIWSPGETANSIQPPERRCNSQELGILCHDESCFVCNSTREANSQTVRGTLLLPCRTAMRGSFPLNGTYFQVNEVFADHETGLNPINVPRALLWKLPRRTVYFGTSIPSIFKGLTTEGIQHCFWRGYVCVRGFDRKTRAPRPLMARLHFPPSKLPRTKGKTAEE